MYQPIDTILDGKDAWQSLRRRPARSLLSGVGIAIGVLALVAMLSIGEGAKREALEKIATLGINTIRVEYAPPEAYSADSTVINLSQGLTRTDALRIGTWLGQLGYIAYYARKDELAMLAGSRLSVGTLIGASHGWFGTENLSLREGRPLIVADIAKHRRVCVTGDDIASTLQVRLGSTIRFHNVPCNVIGILQPKGRLLTEGTGLSTLDFDNSVIMPYTSFPFGRMLGSRRLLDGLVVRLNDDSEARILSAASQVDELLHSRHRGVRDYRLVVPVSLLREARETQALFALIMGSIAGLSLLVGGIGVMNIMLANVAEQTREIGLRMAVGATKGRIVGLYLCHSMLLCFVGGVLGLSGGILTALGVEYYAQWAVAFSGFGLILGPLSALVTGLIFGLYPAFRAAALNPALALREA